MSENYISNFDVLMKCDVVILHRLHQSEFYNLTHMVPAKGVVLSKLFLESALSSLPISFTKCHFFSKYFCFSLLVNFC